MKKKKNLSLKFYRIFIEVEFNTWSLITNNAKVLFQSQILIKITLIFNFQLNFLYNVSASLNDNSTCSRTRQREFNNRAFSYILQEFSVQNSGSSVRVA